MSQKVSRHFAFRFFAAGISVVGFFAVWNNRHTDFSPHGILCRGNVDRKDKYRELKYKLRAILANYNPNKKIVLFEVIFS